MSRAYLNLAAAALGSAFAFAPMSANAGCGCRASESVVYAQPQVYYAQPAPTVVQVQPAPVIVKVAPAPVIVEQASVPTYVVNQGPVYSGPGADYTLPVYREAAPLPPYPYIGGWRWRSRYFHHHHPRLYGNWQNPNRTTFYRHHVGPNKFYRP